MANFSLNQEVYINMTLLQAPHHRELENILAKSWWEEKYANTQFVILSTSVLRMLQYIHAKTSGQVPL